MTKLRGINTLLITQNARLAVGFCPSHIQGGPKKVSHYQMIKKSY